MAGAKRTTLRDVAREAGVSAMSASYALRNQPGVSDATRKKVMEAARKLNYQVNIQASALKTGRNGTIGVLINDFDRPFASRLISHLSDAAANRGVLPIFQQSHSMRNRAMEGITSPQGFGQLCDGLIVASTGLSAEDVRDLAQGKPVVLLSYEGRANVLTAVNPPNEDGSRAAVEHLIERGCSHIGLVGAAYMDDHALLAADSQMEKRVRGAVMALIEHDLSHGPDIFFPCGGDEIDGVKAGNAVADQLERGADIDGLFCLSDTIGVGVLKGLGDRDVRVPQDVKVIGFDGSRISEFSRPSLSTIATDFTQLADNAVGVLLSAIESDKPLTPTKIIAGYTLKARESTAIQ